MDQLIEFLKTDANAANALGALASAAAAFLALLVSVISLGVSLWASHIQRKHNILTVRPLPEVTVADYQDSVRIKLRNNGGGPLIVKSLEVTDGQSTKGSLISWMPPLHRNRLWNTFTHALNHRVFLPDKELTLLELTQYKDEMDFRLSRDPVREALSRLKIEVAYTDVYERSFPKYVKSLAWYGRRKHVGSGTSVTKQSGDMGDKLTP